MGRIYIRNELDEDPRVLRLAAELDLPVLHVVGCLWKLWSYADEHSRGGRSKDWNCGKLPCMSPQALDQLTAANFAVTLEKVGWLEIREDGLLIPRYNEHCGTSQKTRRQAKIRMRRLRERRSTSDAPGNASVTRNNSVTLRRCDASSTASASATASAVKEEEKETLRVSEEKPSAELFPKPEKAQKHRIPADGDWPSVKALVDLYNTGAPDECPAVEHISPQRAQKCRQYLSTFPEREFWVQAFAEIHKAPFLRGQRNGNGGRPFVASFDWLLSRGRADQIENIVKVHDGQYSR